MQRNSSIFLWWILFQCHCILQSQSKANGFLFHYSIFFWQKNIDFCLIFCSNSREMFPLQILARYWQCTAFSRHRSTCVSETIDLLVESFASSWRLFLELFAGYFEFISWRWRSSGIYDCHYTKITAFFSIILCKTNETKYYDLFQKRFIVPATEDQAKIPFGRVNHNKYMVTDNTAYIGTSNWSADYFTNTAGVGLILEENSQFDLNETMPSIRKDLANVFERDWNSPYAVDLKPPTVL